MINIESTEEELEMIDFGRKGKPWFSLPVLGQKGVPMGITSSFSIFWEKFGNGERMSERTVASAWNYFIDSLRDSFPDATRALSMLDQEQFKQVIGEWVKQSNERGGYDPKA